MTQALAGQRGFALLAVLWLVTLLALIGMRLGVAGRVETRIAANLRAEAVAEAAADGAVQEALFRVLALPAGPAARIPAGGLPFRTAIGGSVVEVQVETVAGLVNPNTAEPALLAALLRQLGLEPPAAQAIAAGIVEWRSPLPPDILAARRAAWRAAGRATGPAGAPFRRLAELGAVPGIDPALLARLEPLLSLWNMGAVDAAQAPLAVRQALLESRAQQEAGDDYGAILRVTALAAEPGGGRFTRRATLRLVGTDPARPFRVLSWDGLGP